MKRGIALLLCLALCVVAPSALANTVTLTEHASTFDVTVDLPEDGSVTVENYNGVPYTFIAFDDPEKPMLYISIAPTEEYDGSHISTLTQEELEMLFLTVSADLDAPSYSLAQTAAGYDYMMIEDESETDSAILVMIEDGFFIQLSVWDVQYSVLTETDMQTATALLDSMVIIRNE